MRKTGSPEYGQIRENNVPATFSHKVEVEKGGGKKDQAIKVKMKG